MLLVISYSIKNMLPKIFCCFYRTNKDIHKNNNEEHCIRIKEEKEFTLDKPIEWKDTVIFIPPINKGFVIKVYDGDTITIASKLPFHNSPIYRFTVRLNGIDCPEIKGKTDDEKQCAQIAKKELSDLILHKVVSLKNITIEKYGRLLADVYLDDLHLNEYMIHKRLAVKYNGGKKELPSNWMNYYLIN